MPVDDDDSIQSSCSKVLMYLFGYTCVLAQGVYMAQWFVGIMLLHGSGVQQDEIRGVQWLLKSAAQGSTVSPAPYLPHVCVRARALS
jgi:TPR repeat protein